MKLVLREQIIFSIAIVHLKGRFDVTTTQTTRTHFERLLSRGFVDFVIDLSEILFLDSAGLAMLVFLYKRSQHVNGRIRLVRPERDLTWQTFVVSGFDTFFEFTDTVEAAIRCLTNENMHLSP